MSSPKNNSRHLLYILYNETNNQTYNGYTVDFRTRLRKHNCELIGGAKFTTRLVKSKQVKWKPLVLIKIENQDFDQRRALSLEWSIKYPTNQRPRPARFNSPIGRLEGLALVLKNEKFSDLNINIEVFCQEAFDVLKNIERKHYHIYNVV